MIIDFVVSKIHSCQFGFLKGRSCVHKLLTSLSLIVDSLDKHHSADAIFLDIRKAFDTVNHNKLLKKLHTLGFTGGSLRWFEAYLTDRYHRVKINGHISSDLQVWSGVPQGSIIGPILFLVYVNDMFPHVSSSNLMMFADDSECIKEISSPYDQLLIQEDLDQLETWCSDWDMSFNVRKCVHLHFGSPDEHSYSLYQSEIPCHDSYKDLGVWITSDLTWSQHISHILSSAYSSLNLIRRVVHYSCSITIKRSLYLTLVRSHLIYCSPIWRPQLKKDIVKLEKLQRRATKFITSSDLDYKSRLIDSKLLPLSLWLEAQDVLFLIKLMNDPPDNFNITDYISFVSSSTRAATMNRIKRTIPLKPRLNSTRHFYFNRMVRLWNSLPNIDLQLPFNSIRRHILGIFWQVFIQQFDVNNSCTWFVSCPCTKCTSLPSQIISFTRHKP